jgi:hypothetical protein
VTGAPEKPSVALVEVRVLEAKVRV